MSQTKAQLIDGKGDVDLGALSVSGSASNDAVSITSDNYLRMASGTGGIQFNGDTSAVNALDDYEEGTWTVEFYDAASGGNASSTTATGNYTKVGRMVTAVFGVVNISTAGMTAGNNIRFTLPFAPSIAGRGPI